MRDRWGNPAFFAVSDYFYGSYGEINISTLRAGSRHTVALKEDGTVVAWGTNEFGQIDVPPHLSGVKEISTRGYHTLALKEDGTVTAWGDNDNGQLTIPSGLSGVKAIAAGWDHSMVLLEDKNTPIEKEKTKSKKAITAFLSNGKVCFSNPIISGATIQLFNIQGKELYRTQVQNSFFEFPSIISEGVVIWKLRQATLLTKGKLIIK